jgi:hypothetical protein
MAAATDDRPSPHRRGSRRRLTPGAWKILLVTIGLLGAAVNTGNNLVYLMFSLLAAVLPVSWMLGSLNLRRLRCELRLPKAPRVGAPFTVDVQISAARTWIDARSLELSVLTDGKSHTLH